MTISRKDKAPAGNRPLGLFIGLLIIGFLVVLGISAFSVSQGNSPMNRPAGKGATAPANAMGAAELLGQSLDVFGIEFKKVMDGASLSSTGATGALQKAIESFDQFMIANPVIANLPESKQLQTKLIQLRDTLASGNKEAAERLLKDIQKLASPFLLLNNPNQ
jgi:hypothetical protein